MYVAGRTGLRKPKSSLYAETGKGFHRSTIGCLVMITRQTKGFLASAAAECDYFGEARQNTYRSAMRTPLSCILERQFHFGESLFEFGIGQSANQDIAIIAHNIRPISVDDTGQAPTAFRIGEAGISKNSWNDRLRSHISIVSKRRAGAETMAR